MLQRAACPWFGRCRAGLPGNNLGRSALLGAGDQLEGPGARHKELLGFLDGGLAGPQSHGAWRYKIRGGAGGGQL
jgi:hypothetical protein